jgi:hypothetical protein
MDVKPGDLVFLTSEYDAYIKSKHPSLKIVITNRLAKVEKIIDWQSPEGKLIYKARLDSHKWDGIKITDCKYILSVYYPDIKGRNGESGTVERGLPMFMISPKSGKLFFVKAPDWLYKEILKVCETFMVEKKDVPG